MTSTKTIRSALADLWDTGATAYELAQAVMKAADIESADLELEVESVIARALLAREFVDLSKVAAGVAKVLPGEAEQPAVPLCVSIGREPACLCPCHRLGGVMHVMPCCNGTNIALPEPTPDLPLREAILAEIAEKSPFAPDLLTQGQLIEAIIRKHFAALTVEEVARAIAEDDETARERVSEDRRLKPTFGERYASNAQAVLRLLRRG